MDYTLIAPIGLIVLVVVVSTRYHRRTWSSRPGYQYQRVITVAVLGLWLTVAGGIGWDLSTANGLLRGTQWVDGPVWWQIGMGVPLMALAVFMGRRVPANATRSSIVR